MAVASKAVGAEVRVIPSMSGNDQITAMAVDAPSASAGSATLYMAYIADVAGTFPQRIMKVESADSCTAPCTMTQVTEIASDVGSNYDLRIFSMAFSRTEGFAALYYMTGTRAGVSSYALEGSTAAATLSYPGTIVVSSSPAGDLWLGVRVQADSSATTLVRARGAGLASQSTVVISGPDSVLSFEPAGIAAASNDHLTVCMRGYGSADSRLVMATGLHVGGTPEFAWAANPPGLEYDSHGTCTSIDTASGSSGASVAVYGNVPREPPPMDGGGGGGYCDPEFDPFCRRQRQLYAGQGFTVFIGDPHL